MSQSSYDGRSRSYIDTNIDTFHPSSRNGKTILQSAHPSSILQPSQTSTNFNPTPAPLVCPVSGCSSVFGGKKPHGYLWRHLGAPKVDGLSGDKKAAWGNLHKAERDRLLPTRITPAQRKREARKVKAQKRLRTVEFEQRARNMGIPEEPLITEKVAIWEGMFVAEQNNDSIGYDAWVLLDLFTGP